MWAWEEPARVSWRHYQDWVLPPRVVRVILTLGLFCVFVGMILVSIGSGLHNSRLTVGGGVVAAVGGCCLLVCLLLCLHAFFIFRVRHQAVQTESQDLLWRGDAEEEEEKEGEEGEREGTSTALPNNAVPHGLPGHGHSPPLPLPSALKSGDSTFRREPKKSVSYSGEVQCYSVSPTLSSTSLLSSVFSSTGGTLDRGGGGGGMGNWAGAGGGAGTPPFPPSTPQQQHHHHQQQHQPQRVSQSLPRNIHLRQLIEDNDYDVPGERTAMLVAAPSPPLSSALASSRFPAIGNSAGSVKSAGAEVSMPVSSLGQQLMSRHRPAPVMETKSENSSDYDNI
ncbi:uncharacterized protein LOC143288635 [Babylonia areolata]|uniref:uncharacterized protein LOC143288635 n=1 Tax=Babylonia areolata TaxID=304850 RepID=UPI003FD37988